MKVFVYGSLLSNFQAADLIPQETMRRPAYTIGRLYDCIEHCFPATVIPSDLIQAGGSGDYEKDEVVEKSQRLIQLEVFVELARKLQKDDYSWIHGEVADIEDVSNVMPVLDKYEGFCENSPLYHRSLVPVIINKNITWAWIYHFMSEDNLAQAKIGIRRIYHGSWPKLIWTNSYT